MGDRQTDTLNLQWKKEKEGWDEKCDTKDFRLHPWAAWHCEGTAYGKINSFK